MALAMITVMLWIVWSDTVRQRRPSPILYAVRIALFLIVSLLMLVNLIRYPHIFGAGARALTVVAVILGFVGAGYFIRRLTRRA